MINGNNPFLYTLIIKTANAELNPYIKVTIVEGEEGNSSLLYKVFNIFFKFELL